ncbi:four helix bundle protein [Candidatus Daviesbacteria bacterium]|nr:four helix bundle protein [Candidatus Daviesbacteria bacterium]
MLTSYQQLTVWQKAFDLSIKIFRITNKFPKSELYGLVSQMRRCAVSIPSNIAEGYSRGYRQEYLQFLRTAFASGAELETQVLIAKELNFLNVQDFEDISNLLTEVQKMLNKLISSLKS